MLRKTQFLVTLALISLMACTDYNIKNLDIDKLYNEKTIGDVMNIYSTKIPNTGLNNKDLVVDAQLKNKEGIFDTPIVFISTVSSLNIIHNNRLHYQILKKINGFAGN